ncbi:MAG: HaeIII family restriction endonuclease [Dialister sp.]|nr:HaeIII family restriction endonuclease [Dialister sp.]
MFECFDVEKYKGFKWSDLHNQESDAYVPLLNDFKGELEGQSSLSGRDMPRLMMEYLLDEFDFYKVIGIDSKRNNSNLKL